MHFLVSIFGFSAALAFTIVMFGMAVSGIKNGKIYYESASSPIAFNSRPIAFILLAAFYIALGILFLISDVKLFGMISN